MILCRFRNAELCGTERESTTQSANVFIHVRAIDALSSGALATLPQVPGGHFMRKLWFGLVPTILFCTLTFANPIPTFNLTQGSISLTFVGPGTPTPVDFGFTGPNGVSVGGTGTISSANSCLAGVLAGDVCDPGLGVIFPDSASAIGPDSLQQGCSVSMPVFLVQTSPFLRPGTTRLPLLCQ